MTDSDATLVEDTLYDSRSRGSYVSPAVLRNVSLLPVRLTAPVGNRRLTDTGTAERLALGRASAVCW